MFLKGIFIDTPIHPKQRDYWGKRDHRGKSLVGFWKPQYISCRGTIFGPQVRQKSRLLFHRDIPPSLLLTDPAEAPFSSRIGQLGCSQNYHLILEFSNQGKFGLVVFVLFLQARATIHTLLHEINTRNKTDMIGQDTKIWDFIFFITRWTLDASSVKAGRIWS